MVFGTQELRARLEAERDVLESRLRYVKMTLDGLDGLEATEPKATPDHHVPTSQESDQRPAAPPDAATRNGATGRKYQRGLSATLARQAILEAAGPLTPDALAAAMFRLGWTTPAENPVAAARAAGNRVKDNPSNHIFFVDGAFVHRPPDDATRPTTSEGGP